MLNLKLIIHQNHKTIAFFVINPTAFLNHRLFRWQPYTFKRGNNAKNRIPVFIIAILLSVFIAGQVSFTPAMAQSGVVIDPTVAEGSACAGSSVTYTFDITNNMATEQNFYLEYDCLWPVSGPSTTGEISPGGTKGISVTVVIPFQAVKGAFETLTVLVNDVTYLETASATATTNSAICSDYQELQNLPTGREVRAPSVVFHDGKLYKIGGYGYVSGTGAAKAWLDIYDIATDSWSSGPDMPGVRYWLDCEAINAKIYCAGGYSTTGQSTLYIYDIGAASWSTGASMPTARYNYASAVVDDKYYVMGGYTVGTGVLNTIIVYDPATATWDDTLTPMSGVRRYFQAGAIDGLIYVAGGYNGSTNLSSVEFYNPTEDLWKPATAMPVTWSNAADGVLFDRFLVLVGGYETGTTTASIYAWVYDSILDRWFSLPNLDHSIYSAEGDGDGRQFWTISGRLYEGTWQNSPYIFRFNLCNKHFPGFLPVITQ